MATLPMLTKINLASIALEVLHDNIKDCKKLEYLNLDKNKIETVSEAIGRLKSLKYLSFNNTKLKTLPLSTSLLQNLEKISLVNCTSIEIESLFTSLKDANIQELDLSNTAIESFPENIPHILAKQITLTGNKIKKSEIKRLKTELPYSLITHE